MQSIIIIIIKQNEKKKYIEKKINKITDISRKKTNKKKK